MSVLSLYYPGSSESLGELHRSMRSKAFVMNILSTLTGRSRNLLDLNIEVSKSKIRRQYYGGIRAVPIRRIRGSEGRSGDFDCDFNPIHTRTVQRWVSVAVARSSGATLPPVELIQLGEDYYVRDGHHRISVAQTFGEEYIDAKVVVLELEPVPAPPPTLVAANMPST